MTAGHYRYLGHIFPSLSGRAMCSSTSSSVFRMWSDPQGNIRIFFSVVHSYFFLSRSPSLLVVPHRLDRLLENNVELVCFVRQ